MNVPRVQKRSIRGAHAIHHSKKLLVKGGKKLKNGTSKIVGKSKGATSYGARKTVRVVVVVHRQAIKRPHVYMESNWSWYAKWHAWPKHKIVHNSALGGYLLLVGLVLFSSLRLAFAADLSNSWDFSNSSDYTVDSGLETGSGASLAAQNYTTDANTSALYHLDEASGTTAADSSGNGNNATASGSPTFGTGNLNNAVTLNGINQSLSASDSASLSATGQQTIEGWIKPNSTFDKNSSQSQTIVDKGSYKLNMDRTSGKIAYEIENNNANQWTKRLSDDTNNGAWTFNHFSVESMINYGTDLYAGTGQSRGDGEVWKYNGTTWSKIGGDGMNGSWADQTYEQVTALASNGTALYAGLGNTAGDAEVWTCELSTSCASWSKIAGDGVGGISATYSTISSLATFGGNLYAGTGLSGAGNGDVYRYNGGTSWTQIGGDALNTSWASSTIESVTSLYSDGTYLYAGTGTTINDADLWRYNGTSWTQIGGDSINSGWGAGLEMVRSMTSFGGNLYAGLGDGSQKAAVYKFNGTTWTAIGGNPLAGSWNSTVLTSVVSLANDGTNLYAGLGTGTAGGVVYKYSGSGTAWTAIGGGGVNSSWTSASSIGAMVFTNSKLYATPWSSSSSTMNSMVYEWNGTSWTQNGGNFLNNSWGGNGIARIDSTTTMNGKMYVGLGNVTNAAQVYEYDGTTARRIGGSGLDGSWPVNTYEDITSMMAYKGELYVGLGNSAGDGELWKWNGTSWTKIGGDSINSAWGVGTENAVSSMVVWNGSLYVGLGTQPYQADIWKWDGSTWTLVAGTLGSTIAATGVNGSWYINPRSVESMVVWNDQLCAGLGGTGGYAELWCWTGTGNWVKIGGGLGAGVNSSWPAAAAVPSLTTYKGELYAGVQGSSHQVSVWKWNGTTWTQIAGSDLNNTWGDGAYTYPRTFATYNGDLYLGVGYSGSSNPTGDVWKWNGTTWTQMGGDGLNGGWATGDSREEVASLITYKGKLYAGLGFSGNNDAMIYSYGNNGYAESTTSSFDTSWKHIAATYDGVNMKIYINGTLETTTAVSTTGVDNAMPLSIGSGWGSPQAGEATSKFKGSLDEIRISNTARTSFNSKPYSNTEKTVSLATAIRKSGVASWDGFTSSESAAGGTVNYRLSDDEGATWKYWNGSAWITSSALTDSNPASVVNSNIASFPVTFSGIKWQAVLKGDGTQKVKLNSVALSANSDLVAPSANASNIVAYKSNGGANIASNAWTNGASPYFTWDAGVDAGAGLRGYCLYLGQTSSSDPETTKGILGTSPVDTNSHCQFTVPSNSVDLATAGYLGSALASSNSPYYLNIKAIDKAGNVFGSSEQFQFRFDNTAPTNPGFISAPSGFINTKSATITWPTTGGQAAVDTNSGLSGLQYRFNSGSWYGDDHIGTGDASDLLANDGSYTTTDPSPPDNTDIVDGVNTIYIRTWDIAGNVSTTYTTAALKVNTNGAPTEPQSLVATPSVNTANSFAFSWAAPSTFVGSANNITYCYTINTLPNVSNCSFTVAGDTDLAAGAYATQPGTNTFYVVAKDESGNINYASYASINFTANTPAPGLPINMDIVDVSIKASNNWRLAITWDEPTSVGAGIAAYRVFRSTDNVSYSQIGSSSSPSFVDTGLSQQTYYYKVRACDSANNCSADSAIVSELPTGKFTTPAVLASEPVTSNLTTKRAKIAWSTDRVSDSKISIGTTSGEYSPSEIGNSSQVTAHVIDLDNLAAGTTYYYIAKWTDVDGNTGTSQEYTFTTAPAPVLKEVTTLSINLSSTTLQFTVKDATKVELQYGRSDSFGGVKSINTSLTESTYQLEIDGLDDGVKYLYRILMYDSEGGKYQSSIFSFTTPPRPKISNLRFQPLTGEPTSTQQVTWDTNIPTNSIISYGKVGTTGTLTQAQEQKTTHEIVIRGLEDNSEYFLIAQGRDSNGNVAVSDRQVFKTALDTRSPVISDLVIEPTIRGSGAEARGQIIVSWKTDEPSTSQVAYAEGSAAQTFNNKTAEDAQLTTEHIVIISDLAPSKVYSIMPVSKDKSGNPSITASQAAIVGRASDSVLNIVLNTLRKVFGL